MADEEETNQSEICTVLEKTNAVVDLLQRAIEQAREERWVALSISYLCASGVTGQGAFAHGDAPALLGTALRSLIALTLSPGEKGLNHGT